MALFKRIQLNQVDLDFILAQLTLPGNDPRNAVPPSILGSFGIRDVQGIGNNVLNPTWGAVDQLFPRLTVDTSPSNAQGTITFNPGPTPPTINWTPTSYAQRGVNLVDTSPRIISNLVSNQAGLTELQVQDDPSTTPGGRLSPITGATNPLPYSSFMTFFGQFFDHGLDLVHKGADGMVLVPLLPGDPLYNPTSHTNFMIASRTNTVAVNIGEGSTDALVTALGLTEGARFGAVTGTAENPFLTSGGTIVVNGALISIAADSSVYSVADALNAASQTTNVVASVDATGKLVLTPRAGESTNTISPYIDLSQAYGSAPSHTVFLREYDATGAFNGRLVSEADGSMPTWATVKANAARIGITLHDYNVADIPMVRLNADGTAYRDANGQAWLVAQNKTTGEVVFVQDTAKDALASANLTLVTIGHAFLDDMAHNAFASGQNAAGDLINPAVLNAHYIAGDGRANENIALTAVHEVFHGEHNSVLADIKAMVATRPDAASWTEEMYFQAAKLVNEMEYQHLVFGEFARKFSPNINAFAGYDVTIDAAITAEFAHAVYRFGHSMLTEEVRMEGFDSVTGLGNGTDLSVGLIEAFLNPGAYNKTVAGQVALGSSKEVGYAIDEWVTGALRNNLVGLPLDLATLNIVRGRDSGMPTLNEARAQLFAQTGMTSLKPYASWDDYSLHLLHPESIKNFIAAYSRDAILTQFAGTKTLNEWTALQNSVAGAAEYAAGLDAAAQAALNDATFMTTDQGFQNIDLWLGGLAEAKVEGGMLGTTFDFVFATQMIKLQNGDRFYYLERLAGTNLLAEIEGQLFSDIVMRNTGVKHLYPDIFSVPDDTIELSATGANAPATFGTIAAMRLANSAGYVGDTFYGNIGDYRDARGVLNPNGKGNASEIIGGTSAGDKINAMGGNDAVWGDGGVDTIEGGLGADFLHGGEGNDIITDAQGDDLIWGDEGDDTVNAGIGIDQVFGGDGNDLLYGGLGADVIDGGAGNDTIYGDNTANDVNGDADVIAGGDGDDVLYAGGGGDGMDGGTGNDVLHSGGGADNMVGWDGDDLFIMDASESGFTNVLDGGLGHDVVDYSASHGSGMTVNGRAQGVSIALSAAGAAALPVGVLAADAFLAIEEAIGSAHDDLIIGGAAVVIDQAGVPVLNTAAAPIVDPLTGLITYPTIPVAWTLHGGAGNDTLEGGQANDLLDGGADSDTVSYAAAPAQLVVDALGVVTQLGVTIDLRVAGAQNTNTAGVDTLTSIENVIGSAFNDVLTGNAAANILEGGDGDDVLDGAGGSDTASYQRALAGVTVDLNADQQNTIGAGVDTLNAIENLRGSNFNDDLRGDRGANVIDGGAGNDVMNGDNGTDTVSYVSAAAGVTVSLALITQQNTVGAGLDTLSNFENLTGSAFADRLTGNGGNNVLDGGLGADTMIGGTGNDTYMVDHSGDAVTEAVGGGTDTVVTTFANTSLASFANVENLTFLSNAAANQPNNAVANAVLTGNAVANILTAAAGNDVLNGGAGNDTLNGGAGNDTMVGGTGNDTFVVDSTLDVVTELLNEGTDLVQSSVTYILGANLENLTLTGNANIDATGNAANNTLVGNAGNNILDGGAGADNMNGGAGNDTYRVDNTGDVVSEANGGGTDTVESSVTYTIAANIENLTLMGTAAINGTGNAGTNTLIGNSGNNVLTGGVGRDVLSGGAGADTFRYTAVGDSVLVLGGAVGSVNGTRVGNLEVITDFVRGTDRIDLSAIDARTNANGDQAFNFVGSTAFNGANSNGGLRSFQVQDTQGTWFTVIEASNDNDTNAEFQIALQGQFTLAASDFVL